MKQPKRLTRAQKIALSKATGAVKKDTNSQSK